MTMKNAYKCKPGHRQTKTTLGWGGGAYDKVKEDKYCRGTTGCRNRNLKNTGIGELKYTARMLRVNKRQRQAATRAAAIKRTGSSW